MLMVCQLLKGENGKRKKWMQQLTDVCVCKRYLSLSPPFFISLLFESPEEQCATRYHHSFTARNSIHYQHTISLRQMYANGEHATRKKGGKTLKK